MNTVIKVSLTKKQLKELKPLFDQVDSELKRTGITGGAIVMQPRTYGVADATWVDHETMLKLQAILWPYVNGDKPVPVVGSQIEEL